MTTKIIADISGNHNGDRFAACKLIYLAAKAGCDYVKFQLYDTQDMPDGDKVDNREMYERLKVPDSWLPLLFGQAKECGIPLFASVFSARAVKQLLKFDTPFIKIASPASTKLSPETYDEIFKATTARIQVIASMGAIPYAPILKYNPEYLLYCPPGHPHELTEDDIYYFEEGDFHGFSDHSTGYSNAVRMINLGAGMIEKHIKLDDNCIDAAYSGDYDTFRQLCRVAHGGARAQHLSRLINDN